MRRICEAGPEGLSLIVVAGNRQKRLANAGKRLSRERIFLRRAALDEIAGQKDKVRGGIKRIQRADRHREHCVRIDQPLIKLPPCTQVWVGDMGDQHCVIASGDSQRFALADRFAVERQSPHSRADPPGGPFALYAHEKVGGATPRVVDCAGG